MGNTNSPKSLKGCTFKSQIDDPQYGLVQIYQKDDHQFALVRIASQESQEQMLRYIRDHKEGLTSVYNCQSEYQTHLCSQISVITVGIQYLPKSLDLNKRYTEAQLWYLSRRLCEILIKIPYIDLHPQNIRVTDQGTIKLLDLALLPNNISNLAKVQCGQRNVEYLSPEQLFVLREEHNDPKQEYQLEKQNVFILGVILLSCLTDVRELYNSQSYDSVKCQALINAVFAERQDLSESLKYHISELLNQHTYNRPTFVELLTKINSMNHKVGANLYDLKQDVPTPEVPVQSIILNNPMDPSPYQTNQKNTSPDELMAKNEISLDKLKQLKERFQMMRGETSKVEISTPTKSYYLKKSATPPNFHRMDPVIDKALAKSREILSRCTAPVVQTQVPIQQTVSQINYFQAPKQQTQTQKYNQTNIQFLLEQAEREIQKSNQISRQYFQS